MGAAPMVVAEGQYAAPVQYAAAPMATTVAAPQMVTTAAPVMTTQTPSYVAAPQLVSQAVPINVPAPPTAPVKLTEGIPTPEQIQSQKQGYAAALDKQLKEATDTVAK